MPIPLLIRILSVSDDAMVRSTRELVLRRDGYEIVSIGSNELLSVPAIRAFDMAVVCHSVPPERAMGLIDRLRRYKPEIRVLRVNARAPRGDPGYAVDSEVLAGPGALRQAVRELLDRNAGPGLRKEPCPEGHDEYCAPFPAVRFKAGTMPRT